VARAFEVTGIKTLAWEHFLGVAFPKELLVPEESEIPRHKRSWNRLKEKQCRVGVKVSPRDRWDEVKAWSYCCLAHWPLAITLYYPNPISVFWSK
jgi:hypothetical protein